MTENEFMLQDRIQKIKSINELYDLEKNSYISFSGGKDSTVLSALIDLALPDNKIPRVNVNTGIELKMISDFVKRKAEIDSRIIVLHPAQSITKTLQEYGYPFKSKMHSHMVALYQRLGLTYGIHHYLQDEQAEKTVFRPCPKKLKYQFTPEFKLKISDKCCFFLKEKPMTDWSKENSRYIYIDGIIHEEGGRRTLSKCLVMSGEKIKSFHPLSVISKEFEEWFIQEYKVEISDIYKEPYNFERTGCKGCPFALNLQNELDTLEKFFPNERKQCEIIWKPIYEEYRRIGYRLKRKEEFLLFDL